MSTDRDRLFIVGSVQINNLVILSRKRRSCLMSMDMIHFLLVTIC